MVYSKDILRKLGSRKAPGTRDVLSTLETLRKRLADTGADKTAQALVLVLAAQMALVDAKFARLTAKQESELQAAMSLVEGHEALRISRTTPNGSSYPKEEKGRSFNPRVLTVSPPRGKHQ